MEVVLNKEKQPNLVKAILAATGMGLIGCVLWGILYAVGFLTWVADYVVVFAAVWGYTKFNPKINKRSYVTITLILILEVVLTIFVALLINFMSILHTSLTESVDVMFRVISLDATVKTALIQDIILSMLFITLTVISCGFKRKKKAKKIAAKVALVSKVNYSANPAVEKVADVQLSSNINKLPLNIVMENTYNKEE